MCRRCCYAAAVLVSLLLFPTIGHAQNDNESYQEWKKRVQGEYSDYKRQQKADYEDFRQKANAEYAEFLKRHWVEMRAFKGIAAPQPVPVPPVVILEDEKNKERKDESKPFEEVVEVTPPKPQPQPVEPITPQPINPPTPVTPPKETVSTLFYGTWMQCMVDALPQFTLSDINEKSIARAWSQLSNGQCDELLAQCLELRSLYRLNDWGYIQMLNNMSLVCFPKISNKATLLMAWLYCQSGYKMRLARADERLYMFFASDNIIYNHRYFILDGERFYPYKGENLASFNLCQASFPNERAMTLKMANEPHFTKRTSDRRTLRSKRYPEINVSVIVNRNLIDFYNDYPNGTLTDDFGTRWAMYAIAPLSEEAQESFYPLLKSLLSGKSKLQATEELLNFVQTAFVYEYDDTVWGADRAFFAEETLYYPYADCEDRSILFSRLVRDLLNLKVVLLYYPGHLATAVRFEDEQPKGDYLQLDDGRYYIADPTYIGAPVGVSMPSVRDKSIKVIVL